MAIDKAFGQFESYVKQVMDLLKQDYKEQAKGQLPVLTSNKVSTIRARLIDRLPQDGITMDKLLDDFKEQILPFINRNTDSRYGAYITGSGTPIGAIAELIKGFFNQNGLKWNNSPIAAELERHVIHWIADFVRLPDHREGVLTSGGSMSNLLAIHLALASRFPEREMEGLYDAPRWIIYCSDQTHSSIERAMVFLGLGRNSLKKIPSTTHFQIDLKQLEHTIREDIHQGFKPLMVIGNAGTTNTGSIDPLEKLAVIAKKYDCWYHVDGAYGLPAVRLAELEDRFSGVAFADSVIINPHKWMYVPFEASCILTRRIPQAIHLQPDYLNSLSEDERFESSVHTIELSKEFRALKIWFTLKYYGVDQLSAFIRNDISQVDYLAKELNKHEHWKIEGEHPLSILCFRYEDIELNPDINEEINKQLLVRIESSGKLFLTGTRLFDKTYLRIYFGNPNRTQADVDHFVHQLEFLKEEVISLFV